MKLYLIWILLLCLSSCKYSSDCYSLTKVDRLFNSESEIIFENGNMELAIEKCTKTINRNPKNYVAFSNRAAFSFEYYKEMDSLSSYNIRKIYNDLEQSFLICPEYSQGYRNLISIAQQLSDFDTTIYYSRIYIDKFSGKENKLHFGRTLANFSFALQGTGNEHEAMKYANLAIQHAPGSLLAYIIRGYCFMNLRQFGKAFIDFDTARKIESSNFLATYCYGVCSQMSGNYPVAENYYQKAIQIDPKRAEPFRALGLMMLVKGDTLGACQNLRKAYFLNKPGDIRYLYVDHEEILKEINSNCQ